MGNYCEILHRNKNGIHRTSKKSSKSHPSTKNSRYSVNVKMETGEVEFKVSHMDFVSQKRGSVTKFYTLCDPPLGKGAFGEVRKAVHKLTGIERAIKIIKKSTTSEDEQKRLINEVEMLKKIDHPNVIKVFEFFQDQKCFYIVTELCSGGELFDKIIAVKHFTERQAAEVIRQILSAVFYCHSNNIVHRDLKPENILYESNNPDAILKIIDFGTSRNFNLNQKMTQKFGTPYYIAPEVLKRKYDEKCDIWSIGVILYILLAGYPPFNGPNDRIIMEKVSKGIYSFAGKEWLYISKEAKSFIKKLLEYEPQARYTAEQAFNDPWLREKTSAQLEKMGESSQITQNILTNLKEFRATHKLQHAIWVFLVSFMSTSQEKVTLLKTFQQLDLNGDGQLTKEELLEGYRNIMNNPNPEAEVENIMRMVDSNESGAIDYTEFVMATINREGLLSKQRLEAAFSMFDKDGSGNISIQELKEVFQSSNLEDRNWENIIKEIDENGDGEISFKEFKDMMMKLA